MIQHLQGDCLDVLRTLPNESVHCCVTSPPYWGLRDYGCAGQIGLEPTPQEFVAKLVAVFAEVRRVLRVDGTCWCNLGDSYASTPPGCGKDGVLRSSTLHGHISEAYRETLRNGCGQKRNTIVGGLKPKDLVGIPWRVAFALQADGWYLRSDIIWHKPNPMPESVTDRPTKSHEYIFLLTKSERYAYDADGIRETARGWNGSRFDDERDLITKPNTGRGPRSGGKQRKPSGWDTGEGCHGTIHRDGRAKSVEYTDSAGDSRNKRSVWTIPTAPYSEAHFATFPPDLIKPCILAGCPVGGTVLDPFGGSGTTGMVALELGRKAILIELNPEYVALQRQRCDVTPGLALV